MEEERGETREDVRITVPMETEKIAKEDSRLVISFSSSRASGSAS